MGFDVIYRLKSGTRVEPFADGVLIFSEAHQQIHRLNDSASVLIWRLKDGAAAAQLSADLAAAGLEQATAQAWVRSLLGDLGRMRLAEASLTSARAPPFAQTIRVAGLSIELCYSSERLRDLMAGAFAHLECAGAAEVTYEIFEDDPFVLIGKNGESLDVIERELAAVWLKGIILETILERASYVAALHSACVTANDRAVLLLGVPGAGKTTLTLALLRQGFRYASDDVTLVTSDARVCGVALAPAVKESAWDIASRLGCDLSQAAVHLRPDGQKVRFVQMTDEVLGSRADVSNVLLLRRTSEGAAELKPIGATAALQELLREARSRSGKCSAEVIHVLSEILRRARCFELRYAEADEAARLICESERCA
jgi:hypothetical protein